MSVKPECTVQTYLPVFNLWIVPAALENCYGILVCKVSTGFAQAVGKQSRFLSAIAPQAVENPIYQVITQDRIAKSQFYQS